MVFLLCLPYMIILRLTCPPLFTLATNTAFPHKQPFGIKMCELLCRNIAGCTIYTFESSKLHCQLMDNSTDVDKHVHRVFVNTTDIGAPQCRRKSRLVRIKAEIRCIEPELKETPAMTSFQRILVACNNEETETALYQVFTQTNTIRKYKFFSSKSISALAYISESRKILVGLGETREIITVPLDATGQSTLAHDILAQSIAPDEDKQCLFIASIDHGCTIVRMAIDGSQRRSIKEIGDSPILCGYVALDRRHNRVYACYEKRLVSFAYNGSDYKVVTSLIKTSPDLSIDMVGNVIYYVNDLAIVRRSLVTDEQRNLISLEIAPWRILYHNDAMYVNPVSASMCTSISVFKLPHVELQKEIDLGYKSYKGLIMCPIP